MTNIFTFGSNLAGIHGAGAAREAHSRYGAKWGIGEGLCGYSYAIPTKDERIRTLPLDDVKFYVDNFIDFAEKYDNATFYVTKIGCGLAGFKETDIAPLFERAQKLDNVKLPEDFLKILVSEYSEDKISFKW